MSLKSARAKREGEQGPYNTAATAPPPRDGRDAGVRTHRPAPPPRSLTGGLYPANNLNNYDHSLLPIERFQQ
eukprot:6093908-Pleurochrysis_carterae.AAC.1